MLSPQSFLAAIILGFALVSTAQADTRYSEYCITTASQPGVMFQYDDLLANYTAKESSFARGGYRDSLVKRVDLIETLKSRITRFHHSEGADEETRNAERTDVRFKSGNGVVRGKETIVVEFGGKVVLTAPFLIENDNGDFDTREVEASGLIFNGKSVPLVRYELCGHGAD